MTPLAFDGTLETERDQVESGFTVVLRKLFRTAPTVWGVAFVDYEGECVDYCTALDPYDAKVAGAHLLIVMTELRESLLALAAGELVSLQVQGEARDLLARRVGDGFLVVAIVEGGKTDRRLLVAIDTAADELRNEVGIERPAWDPEAEALQVSIRGSVGWDFAPTSVEQGGCILEIDHVLGRWEEDGGAPGGHLVCFRVSLAEGGELTLAHDPVRGRWLRWG